jgi:hypothetical protein
MQELLADNGNVNTQVVMKDGWAIDSSMSLPYLKEMVAAANELVKKHADLNSNNRMMNQNNLLYIEGNHQLSSYPAFYKFATSSDMIKIISDYLQTVPILINYEIFRSDGMDDEVAVYKKNRFHYDVIDNKAVRVVVHISDITDADGPFSFIGLSDSNKATTTLNYGTDKGLTIVEDDDLFNAIGGKDKLVKSIGPAGTVLFVDTANCFHFGSRIRKGTRLVCMLTFTSVANETFYDLQGYEFQLSENQFTSSDSNLKKLVMNRKSKIS